MISINNRRILINILCKLQKIFDTRIGRGKNFRFWEKSLVSLYNVYQTMGAFCCLLVKNKLYIVRTRDDNMSYERHNLSSTYYLISRTNDLVCRTNDIIFNISMHLLLWMNVMLDFICMSFVKLSGTGSKHKNQNEKMSQPGIEPVTPRFPIWHCIPFGRADSEVYAVETLTVFFNMN